MSIRLLACTPALHGIHQFERFGMFGNGRSQLVADRARRNVIEPELLSPGSNDFGSTTILCTKHKDGFIEGSLGEAAVDHFLGFDSHTDLL